MVTVLVYKWHRGFPDYKYCIFTGTSKTQIGSVIKLIPAPDWPTGKKRVLAVGLFNDGVDQIILDSYI